MGFFLRHPQALAAPLSFRKMFRSYDVNRKAASCTIRLQALPLRSDSEIRGARAIGGIFECLCGGDMFCDRFTATKGHARASRFCDAGGNQPQTRSGMALHEIGRASCRERV